MKQNLHVAAILLVMFLLTQFIGLGVIDAYSPRVEPVLNQTTGIVENVTVEPQLPYGMQPPEMKPEVSVTSIIIAFIIAIFLIILLMKIRAELFLRLWFFIVVIIALSLSINAAFLKFDIPAFLAVIIGEDLAKNLVPLK